MGNWTGNCNTYKTLLKRKTHFFVIRECPKHKTAVPEPPQSIKLDKNFTPLYQDWDLARAAITTLFHMTNVRFPAFYAARVSRKKMYEEIYLMAAILYTPAPLSRGQCCNGGMTWVDSSRHSRPFILFSFYFKCLCATCEYDALGTEFIPQVYSYIKQM